MYSVNQKERLSRFSGIWFKKGTAKVTLHGTGKYGGYKTVTFKIRTRSLADWWKGLFS